MTPEEFRAVMQSIAWLAQMVDGMMLSEALLVAQRALDFGPILDPTAWMKGSHNCEDQIALLMPLVVFQREVARLNARTTEATP